MDEFLTPKKQMYKRSADADTALAVKTRSAGWERHLGISQEEFDKGASGVMRNLRQW